MNKKEQQQPKTKPENNKKKIILYLCMSKTILCCANKIFPQIPRRVNDRRCLQTKGEQKIIVREQKKVDNNNNKKRIYKMWFINEGKKRQIVNVYI